MRKTANGWPDHSPQAAAELLDPILDRIDSGESVEHIPFRLDGLNALTGNGMTPGKLIVIAGHSGHGSTTLALDIASNAAVIYGIPTSLTTLTHSPEEMMQRLLAQQARVPIMRIATGIVDDDDNLRLNGAKNDFKRAPLHVDDNPDALSPLGYGSDKVSRLIVIDDAHMLHVGLVDTQAERADRQAVALKKAAKNDGNTIVVTVPLVAAHGRAFPIMSHFGALSPFAACADLVLLTYRPDAVEREDPRAGEIDIIVAKHRNGPTGIVAAAAQMHYSRIVDLPR